MTISNKEFEGRLKLSCCDGYKVLVIEDDDGLSHLLTRQLSREGFEADVAVSGADALEKVSQGDYDILLVDYHLPDIPGEKLIEQLRERKLYLPFIVVTGAGDQEIAVRMMKLGARDYLIKDHDFLQRFMATVKRVCVELDKEKRLDQAEEALRLSEERFDLAVRGSSDGIWDWYDIDGGKQWWSPRFYELLGYEDQEISADYRAILKMLHPDDRSRVTAARKNHFGHRAPFDVEHRLKTKSGEYRWFHTRGQAVWNGEGKPVRMAGSLQDITERIEAEDNRRQLEAQLRQRQKMETIGTLAGGIAHDFNNILAAIYGYLSLAKRKLSDESAVHEDLDGILKAAERAKDLVQQILAFSRKSESERKPLSIHEVVRDALRLTRASIPALVNIKEDIRVEDATVVADETELHQVIMNLCANAYHAMQEKGGDLRVKLERTQVDEGPVASHVSLPAGEYVLLTISDTGHGMDAATLERVFEPFFTTKKVGEGTGMGLSMVHGIIQKHKGCITVESDLGKGTTFHIYLPITMETQKQRKSSDSQSPLGRKESVLFVDDEEAIVLTSKYMLEDLGYRVSEWTDVSEALAIFEREPQRFDLIITDQSMPRVSGIELIARARQIKPRVPVILTTGYSDSLTKERLEELKIDECLLKPFTIKTLSKTIRTVLDKQAALEV